LVRLPTDRNRFTRFERVLRLRLLALALHHAAHPGSHGGRAFDPEGRFEIIFEILRTVVPEICAQKDVPRGDVDDVDADAIARRGGLVAGRYRKPEAEAQRLGAWFGKLGLGRTGLGRATEERGGAKTENEQDGFHRPFIPPGPTGGVVRES
jgi:hypothetical protein